MVHCKRWLSCAVDWEQGDGKKIGGLEGGEDVSVGRGEGICGKGRREWVGMGLWG